MANNEYLKQYQREFQKDIKLKVTKDVAEQFDLYCKDIGVIKARYIKDLINDDMIRRGYAPLFIDKRFKQ